MKEVYQGQHVSEMRYMALQKEPPRTVHHRGARGMQLNFDKEVTDVDASDVSTTERAS